ncbi:MAG: cell division protein FtsA [Atribacterota bacterium]
MDVGTSKICTLIGRKHGAAVEILGVGLRSSSGIRKGRIVDIGKVAQALRDSFLAALEVAQVLPNVVYAGIAGDGVTSFNLEGELFLGRGGREITERDAESAIESTKTKVDLKSQRILHLFPQEFIVDEQKGVADPVGMVATQLRVRTHLVLAQENHLHNFVKSFQQAGIDVTGVAFQPLASALAVLSPTEKEIGVALVDIGGGTTDITVFYGGSPRFSKVIPIGGEHITLDLAVGLRTSRDEAERVKVHYGCAFSRHIPEDEVVEVRDLGGSALQTIRRRYACEIIEARIREIFTLLARELRASGWGKFLQGGIVLTGGTALLDGIVEFAASFLKVPVRLGYPESTGYTGMVQTIANPMFSTACGLLQLAILEASAKKRPSLLESFQRTRSWFVERLKDYFMIE